jgi:hypothetical protein
MRLQEKDKTRVRVASALTALLAFGVENRLTPPVDTPAFQLELGLFDAG